MENKLLSVILLSYYSNEKIERVYKKLGGILNENNIPFEFIVMDDGSTDNTYKIALDLEKKYPNIHSYQLSRNYTSHYSIFAALSVCNGACAIPIPDDEQQPYSNLVDMYRLWEKGEKIIIPHRLVRKDKFFKNITAGLFYVLMNKFSDIKFPKGGADTFFIDREVIDIINDKIHPIRTTSISEVLRLGFTPYFYGYERPASDHEKSRWTLKKKITLTKDFLFSSSTFPIKFISYIGLFFSMFSVLITIFYGYIKIFGNDSYWLLDKVPGWTSTFISIAFFSGLILLSLGVIAEYIWRIYEEVKARPGYIIKKKN